MSTTSRRLLGGLLTVIFLIALLMGPGPGLILIRETRSVFGFPALYAWGLLWYSVEVSVVIAAYLLVWKEDDADPAS